MAVALMFAAKPPLAHAGYLRLQAMVKRRKFGPIHL
jgi:hypothetical protein